MICTAEQDRAAELQRRLNAVVDHCGDNVQVIVVDNTAAGEVRFDNPDIDVVRCAVPGLSISRAVGCAFAAGRVIVMTDDDVEFGAEWPLRIAAPIVDDELDLATVPVVLGPEFAHVTSSLRRRWLAEANLQGLEFLLGAGMAFRKQLLGAAVWDDTIGAGRDPYGYGEDSLFGFMARQAGARFGWVDAPVTHHPDPARLRDGALRRAARLRGCSQAYIAHHWEHAPTRLARVRLLYQLLRLAKYRLRRPTDGGASDVALELRMSVAEARARLRLRHTRYRYTPERHKLNR